MLPPLPSFLPAKPADSLPPDLTIYPDVQVHEAGPSRSTTATATANCSICSSPPKYTCPRCSTRTCSVTCIRTHKSNTGCSGTRDPTKFVTLTEFGQGDWGGDYAYLENGRRKIADWGKDLPIQSTEGSNRGYGNGNGRGGRGGRHDGGKRGLPKMEGLRRELENRGVEVEFMPEGMGRRKLNQSSWNPKTQALHLTIQFQIPYSLLDDTQSSNSSTDIKTINHLRVLFASPTATSTSTDLPTLSTLLPALSEEVILLLPFHPSYNTPTPIDILLRQPRPKLYFPPLRTDISLEETFKGVAWVEFPVIQVMSRTEWEKRVGEGIVAVVPISQVVERGEKRKMDESPHAQAQTQVQSQSRSQGEIVHGPDKKVKLEQGGLVGLGGYGSGSDEEEAVEEEMAEDGGHDMVVTEEDVMVLHALGAAAAADMA